MVTIRAWILHDFHQLYMLNLGMCDHLNHDIANCLLRYEALHQKETTLRYSAIGTGKFRSPIPSGDIHFKKKEQIVITA